MQRFMPAGGERNLSLGNLSNERTRSIADLYANVQPGAAQGLAGLGTSAGGLGTSGYGALTGYQAGQNQAKGQAMGGVGSGLGAIAGSFLGPAGAALGQKFGAWV